MALGKVSGMAGDGREVPNTLFPFPWHFWEQFPLTLCPCVYCLELSLPGVSLSLVSSLSGLTDPIPPTECSALPCRHLLAVRHSPGTSLCVQGKGAAQTSANQNWGLSAFSRIKK